MFLLLDGIEVQRGGSFFNFKERLNEVVLRVHTCTRHTF